MIGARRRSDSIKSIWTGTISDQSAKEIGFMLANERTHLVEEDVRVGENVMSIRIRRMREIATSGKSGVRALTYPSYPTWYIVSEISFTKDYAPAIVKSSSKDGVKDAKRRDSPLTTLPFAVFLKYLRCVWIDSSLGRFRMVTAALMANDLGRTFESADANA